MSRLLGEVDRLLAAGVRSRVVAVRCAVAADRQPRAPRPPREHGTERGYAQHHSYGTPTCARCRAAHARAANRARLAGSWRAAS